jgi:hypothetical protein
VKPGHHPRQVSFAITARVWPRDEARPTMGAVDGAAARRKSGENAGETGLTAEERRPAASDNLRIRAVRDGGGRSRDERKFGVLGDTVSKLATRDGEGWAWLRHAK